MVNNESVYKLQRDFRKNLCEKGYTLAEANVISNDALFLHNKNLKISFVEFLTSGISEELNCIIVDYFRMSGDYDFATKKANQYIFAMKLLYEFYNDFYCEKIEEDKIEINDYFLLNYCRSMRVLYSYKPLLIIALANTVSKNGETTLSEIAYYFIKFYANRIDNGLIAEKEDSIFSVKEINFSQAKQNILNNAARIFAKDGIIKINEERISLTEKVLPSFQKEKEKLLTICEELLLNYYNKIHVYSNGKEENEKKLGAALSNMYSNCMDSEKVTMIHLFGIKYADLIESENLSIRNIVLYSGISESYYAEIRKGMRLSKYVKLK